MGAGAGFKPVCDHSQGCKKHKDAIYIGNKEYRLSRGSHRKVNGAFPSGWAAVKRMFNGDNLCYYHGKESSLAASCSISTNASSDADGSHKTENAYSPESSTRQLWTKQRV